MEEGFLENLEKVFVIGLKSEEDLEEALAESLDFLRIPLAVTYDKDSEIFKLFLDQFKEGEDFECVAIIIEYNYLYET